VRKPREFNDSFADEIISVVVINQHYEINNLSSDIRHSVPVNLDFEVFKDIVFFPKQEVK
jgi:hypothetical protein